MRDIVNQNNGLPKLEWRDFPYSKKNIYQFLFLDFLNHTETVWKDTVYHDYLVQCCNDYGSIDAFRDHEYILSIPVKSLKPAWNNYSRTDKPKDFNLNKRYVVMCRFKRTKKNRMRFTDMKVIDVKDDIDKFKTALIQQIKDGRVDEE